MPADEAWEQIEATMIALLREAFKINCYRTDQRSLIFIDQDMPPESIGAHAMPWSRNVWRFTPEQFRACVKSAAQEGVTHEAH